MNVVCEGEKETQNCLQEFRIEELRMTTSSFPAPLLLFSQSILEQN